MPNVTDELTKRKRTARRFHGGPFECPGDDLLSRSTHYHGPRMLNGRVRNGNGCGHPGMVTGKSGEGREIRDEGREKAAAFLAPRPSPRAPRVSIGSE